MAQIDEDLDFEVRQEVWNIYELEDGSTIRLRAVLIKVLKSRKLPPPPPGAPPGAKGIGLNLSINNLLSVKSPIRLKGKPTKPIDPRQMPKLPKTEVKFNPFYEDWNIYLLKDGTELRVKINVSKIERVEDKYDKFGNPMYNVQSVPAITAQAPKKIG